MTTRTDLTGRKYSAWLSPTRIALLGAVIVGLLLTLPIYTLGPGDHEEKSCGNALSLDLALWRGDSSSEYYDSWESAHRVCTSERIDRVIQAVGVVSVTLLIVTFVSARTRRSSPSGESGA